MKRVNLLDYFELAEGLLTAKRTTQLEKATVGSVYFATFQLPVKLKAFVDDENGFNACKHVANEVIDKLDGWVTKYAKNDRGDFDIDKFNTEQMSWQYSDIDKKLDQFKGVFEAEARDVDVYSVGQIAIYKTSALVSGASGAIPPEVLNLIPQQAGKELNDAGRCLAFDLPTACGFHALRALELVMDSYLNSYGVETESFRSWMDYIHAATDLVKNTKAQQRPSPKVAAMLDRMRELDRNPLMHPRDTLDAVSADMLFKLTTITVIEMAKDLGREKPKLGAALTPGVNGIKAIPAPAKEEEPAN